MPVHSRGSISRTAVALLGGFAALLSAAPAGARGPGSTSGLFMALATGARPAGMGESFVASADDVHALSWNPAGLALLDNRFQVNLGYMSHHVRGSEGQLRAAYKLTRRGEPLATLGTNFIFYSAGRIQGAGPNGVATNPFTPVFLSGGLGAGWNLRRWPEWAVGLQVKFLYETINGQGAAGGALDVGAQWRTPVRGLIAAASYQNFGPSLAGPDPLPQTARLGFAWKTSTIRRQRMSFETDIVHLVRQDRWPALHGGVEYAYQVRPDKEVFFVRAGVVAQLPQTDVGANGVIRAGFGFKLWKRLQFDYAYQGSGLLYQDPHRFDLTFGF